MEGYFPQLNNAGKGQIKIFSFGLDYVRRDRSRQNNYNKFYFGFNRHWVLRFLLNSYTVKSIKNQL